MCPYFFAGHIRERDENMISQLPILGEAILQQLVA